MKKAQQQKKKRWYQNGFTLLFATLVASLVLSLGVSILDITLQNFILSSTGRESQYAFYAADSGLECALYWDRKFLAADGSSISAFPLAQNDPNFYPNTPTSVNCNGYDANFNDTSLNWTPIYGKDTSFFEPQVNPPFAETDTYFSVPAAPSSGSAECYSVEVQKSSKQLTAAVIDKDGNVVRPATFTSSTTIMSRGYNTCDVNNLRRLERGIQISF